MGSTGDDSADDAAEFVGDKAVEIEDTSKFDGVVDGERDCPDAGVADDGDNVPESEPEIEAVVVVEAVPVVEAETVLEVDDWEAEPAPAVVTTKESIVNSLGPTPVPTVSWSVCCLFSRPLTLKYV